jgi:hypothetical protein
MSEYLTAQQARNNTLEAQGVNGAYMKQETEKILAAVLKASQQGQSSLTIDCADTIVASRLRTLGYTAKITNNYRDSDFMTITW